MKTRFAAVLAAWAFAGAVPALAQDTAPQRFPLPGGHGTLTLQAPKAWKSLKTSTDEPPAVLLRFGPQTGQAYVVQLTAVFVDPGKSAKEVTDTMRADLLGIAAKMMPEAIEKEAKIVELRGPQSLGYHFSLT